MGLTLGKIKQVPLRTIWKHETLDFTPWLVDNLAELGSVLGLELEYVAKEVPVGPYSADILANGYYLSINRYKEVVYDEVEYDPPKVTLERLARLEDEIAKGQRELEEMLQ